MTIAGVDLSVPYWSDGLVTLYLGDCRKITEWLTADVLVTDPPYGRGSLGINVRQAGRFSSDDMRPAIIGDKDTSLRDAALSAWGARPAVMFGDLRVATPVGTKQVVIYRKPSDAGYRSTAGFRRDVEGIYLIGLPAGYGGRSSCIETRTRKSNEGSIRYGHPHAKPVDVMETLIAACPPGTITDPFAGSGSTLVAARNLGRKAIGVELEERYCEGIARRLDQAVMAF